MRQKVPHKRTFLHLEQLVLKHQAHQDTINIKEVHEGIDFYFAHRNQAEKFLDFLTSVTPIQLRKSQELISHDIHTSTKQYKFTFSAELVPICREDLVALPLKVAKAAGNISPLALCYKIGTSINLLDPTSLQTADISRQTVLALTLYHNLQMLKNLSSSLCWTLNLLASRGGISALQRQTVSLASDMDKTYYVRTHLGHLLHPGDSVLGFHLSGTNFNNPEFEAIESSRQYGSTIPDAILVKKHYPRRKRQPEARLASQTNGEGRIGYGATQTRSRPAGTRLRAVFARFEEDPEMRAGVNLYKQQKNEDAMEIESTINGSDDGGLRFHWRTCLMTLRKCISKSKHVE